MTQAWAFGLTLLLEAPFAVLMARWLGSPRAWWWAAAAAVLGSTITHPFLWWAGVAWAVPAGASGPWRMLLLEVGVTVVESLLYAWLCRLSPWRALVASGATNAFSAGVGAVIYAVQWVVQ